MRSGRGHLAPTTRAGTAPYGVQIPSCSLDGTEWNPGDASGGYPYEQSIPWTPLRYLQATGSGEPTPAADLWSDGHPSKEAYKGPGVGSLCPFVRTAHATSHLAKRLLVPRELGRLTFIM